MLKLAVEGNPFVYLQSQFRGKCTSLLLNNKADGGLNIFSANIPIFWKILRFLR